MKFRRSVSPDILHNRKRRIRLLEYLCDMVLLGRQDEIKETTIALELFDRTSQFDDKKDAIVRVEAHRLRERLAKYYATDGSRDRIVIELAPGGYIPRFIARTPKEGEPAATAIADSPVRNGWFEPRWKMIVFAVPFLVLALSGGLALSRRTPVPGTPGPPALSATVVPASAEAIRILAGSTEDPHRPCRPPVGPRRIFHRGCGPTRSDGLSGQARGPEPLSTDALRRLQLCPAGASRRLRIVAALCGAHVSGRKRCGQRGR